MPPRKMPPRKVPPRKHQSDARGKKSTRKVTLTSLERFDVDELVKKYDDAIQNASDKFIASIRYEAEKRGNRALKIAGTMNMTTSVKLLAIGLWNNGYTRSEAVHVMERSGIDIPKEAAKIGKKTRTVEDLYSMTILPPDGSTQFNLQFDFEKGRYTGARIDVDQIEDFWRQRIVHDMKIARGLYQREAQREADRVVMTLMSEVLDDYYTVADLMGRLKKKLSTTSLGRLLVDYDKIGTLVKEAQVLIE